MSSKFINFGNAFIINIKKVQLITVKPNQFLIDLAESKKKQNVRTICIDKTIQPKFYNCVKRWVKNLQKI